MVSANWRSQCVVVLIGLAVAAAVVHAEERGKSVAAKSAWRDSFPVDKADLADVGRNRYFILEPGHRLSLQHGRETLVVSVLDDTKLVDGVKTRIVEEREADGGRLKEVSRNYFAISKTTGDLYYFGEAVDIYKNGKVTSHEGAWEAGVNGAKFGLMIPGRPVVGDRYMQEIAPGVAMDRAEILSVSESFRTPAGSFKDCLRTRETSALERGSEEKLYAPDVGLLRDGDMLLVKVEKPKP